MTEPNLVDGLIILVLRIRDVDAREQVVHRLCDIGDQVTPTIYELNTGDWDPELWEEEVNYIGRCLEGTRDRVIAWRFVGQTYTRFTIGGNE